MWVKKYVKICVMLFKMLKSVFEFTYQTPPRELGLRISSWYSFGSSPIGFILPFSPLYNYLTQKKEEEEEEDKLHQFQ